MDRCGEQHCKFFKCLIIVISALTTCVNISLVVFSVYLETRYGKTGQNTKTILHISLFISSPFTLIVSIIGIIGALRHNYRLINYFALLVTVNALFSIYQCIKYKVFGLLILTALSIMILIFATIYEKSLNKSDTHCGNSEANSNHVSVSVISNTIYSESPPQYEPPPAYSEELAKMAKNVV